MLKKTMFKIILVLCLFFCEFAYAEELTITWDRPLSCNLESYDLRINENNATIINIPEEVCTWSGNLETKEGQNVLDMRSKNEVGEVSIWSVPCYFNSINEILSQELWELHYVDSEELVGENGLATNAFDNNINTHWHTEWKNSAPPYPHEIQINLNDIYEINGFNYLPRQDGHAYGRISQYEFYTSLDGITWGVPVAIGTFVNDDTEKKVTFSFVVCKFIRLKALDEVNDNPWTSMAELNIEGHKMINLPSPPPCLKAVSN